MYGESWTTERPIPPMPVAQPLQTLAHYLAGEFDNQEQAIAEPAWYVHLRLWHRPVYLFTTDSVVLFAEQANVLTPEQPYRQRLLRLQAQPQQPTTFQVQYYAFKDPSSVKGAGKRPELLERLGLDQVELLKGCVLDLQQVGERFIGSPPPDARCYFTYDAQVRQVCLGFEAGSIEFWSYDKGVEPETGKALWGAIMGPYKFMKRQPYPLRDESNVG